MVVLIPKPKLEKDFEPGDSTNLPKVDCFTVGTYFVTMNKTLRGSEKKSYDDETIGYVQLCRKNGLCTLKAMVSPLPQVHANVTVILNEITNYVLYDECDDCKATLNGCMHGGAFLLWLFERSEGPSPPHIESYWKTPKIAQDDTKLKFKTAKQTGTKRRFQPDPSSAHDFFSRLKRRLVGSPIVSYLVNKESNANS